MLWENVAIAVGASGFVSAVGRALAIWVRSRHPRRVTLRVGGIEASLDLSKPGDAERYLQILAKPDSEDR
ncbi:hypothetical protein ACFQ7G_03725 [Streptomyces massasporeus]